MNQYKIHFSAGKDYTTTVSAETSGEAQEKFAKWYDSIFKPQRKITVPAKVTKVDELKLFNGNPIYNAFKDAFGKL